MSPIVLVTVLQRNRTSRTKSERDTENLFLGTNNTFMEVRSPTICCLKAGEPRK